MLASGEGGGGGSGGEGAVAGGNRRWAERRRQNSDCPRRSSIFVFRFSFLFHRLACDRDPGEDTLRKRSAAARRGDGAPFHLSMPNKTNLKLPRGARWTFPCLTFLPAAINSSHLQDVKSCGSTKETETNEHQLFYFCIYLFLYLFSFSSNQRPFPATSCISMSFIICVFK